MQTPPRQLDRLDRHVLRSYVSTSDRVSRYWVEFSLEEALRLVELPGEREGRVYFFRSVSLPIMDGQASRSVWTNSVQQVLSIEAAQAKHGTDPLAGAANAVYFDNHEQGLETLLTNALCHRPPEWFSNLILQLPPGVSSVAVVFAAVDRLRQTLPPAAFAALLLSVVENLPVSTILPLLESIPEADLRGWLREIDPTDAFDARSTLLPTPPLTGFQSESLPVPLKATHRAMIVFAARNFGWHVPRTLWLAALAVRFALPAYTQGNQILRRTRATVRSLEFEVSAQQTGTEANAAPERRSITLHFDEDESDEGESDIEESSVDASRKPFAEQSSTIQDQTRPLGPATETRSGEASQPSLAVTSPSAAGQLVVRTTLLGEPTNGAGLCFLLNVIRRLGIVDAIETCPALTEAEFVSHLLRELAQLARVPANDPMLLAVGPAEAKFALPEALLTVLPRLAWPANLRPQADKSCTAHELLRAWTLGVRRWCWHYGRLKLSEIVVRKGKVWATLTDIDVTLPLKLADVRIRRVGLDIDPGWLPWMGRYGRVVRFHYREAESGFDSDWETPSRKEPE
jgi:hypothetical protein